MDITITLKTGGGRKQNAVSHSKTIKEVQTTEQVIEEFTEEFTKFFPKQEILPTKQGGKK
jgi:hypothetical protein